MASKKKVTGLTVKLQSGTPRTYYATWNWSKKHTKEYELQWYYSTSQGVWFIGSDSTSRVKNGTYSAPDNATAIRVRVKPTSETHKVNNKDVTYWTASWSNYATVNLGQIPPEKPPTPTVTISDFSLTASVDYYGDGTVIEFEIIQNDQISLGTAQVGLATNHAAYKRSVSAGSRYKVRARAKKWSSNYSDWTEYSDNVETIPSNPARIKSVSATSSTSVAVTWDTVNNADSYEVQYTTNRDYFDTAPSEVQSATVENVTTANITGMDTGQTWYFRLRAINEQGNSGWTPIVSCVIGSTPSPPTTWSSATTVVGGETVTLSWVHNSEDNSAQTAATLEMIINGVPQTREFTTETSYEINTEGYKDASTIQWRVKTKGITTDYSDWSMQRSINVYAPVSLGISGLGSTVGQFPIVIELSTGLSTQRPISYHVSIIANESYETVNYLGDDEFVSEGQEVYSKNFDTSANPFRVGISAGDVNLDNNISYTLVANVATDVGLSSSASVTFTVEWYDETVDPNAEIGINDADCVSVYIRPYVADDPVEDPGYILDNESEIVLDSEGAYISDTSDDPTIFDPIVIEHLIAGVTLSVYRREFDGSFTLLMDKIQNDGSTVIVDPHPALDYARYRIVAINDSTGAVSYYDMPGYPIQEKAIILQWDEKWSSFNIQQSADENYERDERTWSGSLLRLPWNIDISDKNTVDVSMTEYIGRRSPVSYYGTQIGQTATWNTDIRADDEETLYALRRLAVWMGDVYVREPSGSGYWAHVNVSFSRKHTEMVVPVTLEITRVEGGV